MNAFFEDEKSRIFCGDNRAVLPLLPENSVDSIVTDPPYELGFMGKAWDKSGIANDAAMWREALRVLKPGGYLLSFGGSRTYHRMACAIENAGFEIRDQIMWVYGSGFPKSLDVSKAIDKAAGAEREVVAVNKNGSGTQPSKLTNHGEGDTGIGYMDGSGKVFDVTASATDAAKQWEGWGTALKPAHEPICVARKPIKGTVAANVLKHGTGALNIDRCRIRVSSEDRDAAKNSTRGPVAGKGYVGIFGLQANYEPITYDQNGRWPANLIHDGSEEVLSCFPDAAGQQGFVGERNGDRPSINTYGDYGPRPNTPPRRDSGSAARFFYTAKADSWDRNQGLQQDAGRKEGNPGGDNPRNRGVHVRANNHPTVKPTDLMRYLCRLVTQPGGIVLDPFMGSGSTRKAALAENLRFIGIELEERYCEIASLRAPQSVLDFS